MILLNLQDNVSEMMRICFNVVYTVLWERLGNWIISKLSTWFIFSWLPKFVKTSKIWKFFFGSDSKTPVSAPERSNYEIIEELFIACFMGVIIGIFVHLTIQLTLFLLSTRLMSMFVSLALTVVEAVMQKVYIFTMIYSICVILLSIAAVYNQIWKLLIHARSSA